MGGQNTPSENPESQPKAQGRGEGGFTVSAWALGEDGAQNPPCPLRGRVPTTHQGSVSLLSGYNNNIVYHIYNLISSNALTPIYLNLVLQ